MCSSCKKPLGFDAPYYVCSVSTCRRKKTGLTFCSLPCFDAHLPQMRHREAWAEEERSPTRQAHLASLAEEADKLEARKRAPKRAAESAPLETRASDEVPREVLIVVSKLKAYIRAVSGMNTSDGVTEVLSEVVRKACDGAIDRALAEERRTVLARDFDVTSRPGVERR